jgi:hypothetical protein
MTGTNASARSIAICSGADVPGEVLPKSPRSALGNRPIIVPDERRDATAATANVSMTVAAATYIVSRTARIVGCFCPLRRLQKKQITSGTTLVTVMPVAKAPAAIQ